ncbi:uncharacterized protein V6R79_006349 [Siganus canaliculatus]
MNVSIPSILVSLGGKCLLNWTLVFLQSDHICRSFLGVFSVTLAVVDATLTLSVAAIYSCADSYMVLLGLHITRYHICLLVQILGQVYSALQWPVVLLAGLDHLCAVTQRLLPTTTRIRWRVYLFVTSFLWYFSAVYVFLLSGFTPVLEDVAHSQIYQCWTSYTSQILQIVLTLLLTLCCETIHAQCCTNAFRTDMSNGIHIRRRFVHRAVRLFLNTWASFLAFLAALLLLLPAGIPAYLGLNCVWLCFLHSLLIAVALCAPCPALQLVQGLAAVPLDSFCEWRLKFSSAAEDRTRPDQGNT